MWTGCLQYVPGPGIEPTTFQLQNDTPTNRATPARAVGFFITYQGNGFWEGGWENKNIHAGCFQSACKGTEQYI